MANSEHIQQLKNGVESWNRWRDAHKKILPDLSGASLSNLNLNGVNFREANLAECQLRGAFLRHSNLQYATLRGANLRSTDFRSANLRRADLAGVNLEDARLQSAFFFNANLENAVMTNARLNGANFSRANFSGANLKGIHLVETVFADSNLSDAQQLDECRHLGPCSLDEKTVVKSGNLPKAFLRGCGLSDAVIALYLSLTEEASAYHSCFISHSSEDAEFANQLYADLQDNGVRCWFAPEDFKIGDRLRLTIDESIENFDRLLIILSEKSISSQWVEQEIEAALEKERRNESTVLFPIRLDETVMTVSSGWARLIRNTRHVGDFRSWQTPEAYNTALERLLRDLKA